jgi:hypothetical protein
MDGPIRICKRCGHRCHCYDMTCQKCVNDVCGFCDCEEKNKKNN